MDRARGPPGIRAAAELINGESGLAVGFCRNQAKTVASLPSRPKEGPNGVAANKPFSPWRHCDRAILFQESYKAVYVVPLPRVQIAPEKPLLGRI